PREENVLDARPSFRWQERAPGSSYELELYRGETRRWSTHTAEAHVDYPAASPALEPGRYRWQLSVQPPSGRPEMDGVGFTVLDAAAARRTRAEIAAAQALVPEGSGANLPLISVYVQHQLYTPAEAALQQALAAAPEDATLRWLLAQVSGAMGRTRE